MKRDEPNLKSVFVQLRKEKGLSQKTVAQELEINEQTVRNWEHGRTVPTLTVPQMKRLCKLLQLPIEQVPDNFGPAE
ncbi:MAG: helix-turn-helix transcriptional regulator [Cyanobacteria bacterium J06635_15]